MLPAAAPTGAVFGGQLHVAEGCLVVLKQYLQQRGEEGAGEEGQGEGVGGKLTDQADL